MNYNCKSCEVSRCFFAYQIEYSRAMMNNTVDKAAYVWTEINMSEEEVAKKLTSDDAETRAHADSVNVSFACCPNLH